MMNNEPIRFLKGVLSVLGRHSSFVIRHPSFLWLLSSFVIRHSSIAQPSPIAEAREALAAEVPEVAIEKLWRLLATLPIGSEGQPAVLTLLAEAQLQAGRADDTLETLSQITPGDDARIVRLRALSLVALGRWTEALAQFETLAASGNDKTAALTDRKSVV